MFHPMPEGEQGEGRTQSIRHLSSHLLLLQEPPRGEPKYFRVAPSLLAALGISLPGEEGEEGKNHKNMPVHVQLEKSRGI